jgi:hypothetical protein
MTAKGSTSFARSPAGGAARVYEATQQQRDSRPTVEVVMMTLDRVARAGETAMHGIIASSE